MKHLLFAAGFAASAVSPNISAYTLAELCEYSSRGQSECLNRLTAFYQSHHQDPLSDDELSDIYGCLNTEGLDIPGCDDQTTDE